MPHADGRADDVSRVGINELMILTTPGDLVRPNVRPPAAWQKELRDAIRDPRELCRMLDLSAEYEAAAVRAADDFPLFVPRGYASRIRRGDPHDPLLRQVLPLDAERLDVPGFGADPVGDAVAALGPGLLQKYQGRALMVATGACAVHCRYCFRRHYPYSDGPRSLDAWEPALEQIAADPTLDEVLLSGGDPLTLLDNWLLRLARRLAAIPHLRRLRVHTRLPIVIPERVCDELLDWLRGTRLVPIVVVHANHPVELDDTVAQALARLVDAGVVVLNQAVLLRGVNDQAEVLVELCRRLVDLRVMPYYLHQLDRVRGAAHFEVEEEVGRRLVAELRARLPGYAVPRYVREAAGQEHKLVLA
jgi:EF-P beta-lysylation protein EpmB